MSLPAFEVSFPILSFETTLNSTIGSIWQTKFAKLAHYTIEDNMVKLLSFALIGLLTVASAQYCADPPIDCADVDCGWTTCFHDNAHGGGAKCAGTKKTCCKTGFRSGGDIRFATYCHD